MPDMLYTVENQNQPRSASDVSASSRDRGLGRAFLSDLNAERRKGWFVKGIWRQQKEMMHSPRQAQFFDELAALMRRVIQLKVQPTRHDNFEEAVTRQGLSEAFLHARMQRHKWIHLLLYVFAGVLLVYGFWMVLNVNRLLGGGVLVVSLCVAINGYLHGFRAWQIEHRNLIRLQDAIRIPGTYLVL